MSRRALEIARSSSRRRSFICLLSEKQNCERERAVIHPRSLATFYLIELMFYSNPGNAYTCTNKYGTCYFETKGSLTDSLVFPTS